MLEAPWPSVRVLAASSRSYLRCTDAPGLASVRWTDVSGRNVDDRVSLKGRGGVDRACVVVSESSSRVAVGSAAAAEESVEEHLPAALPESAAAVETFDKTLSDDRLVSI